MPDELKILHLPPDSGLVETTPEEVADFMCAHGSVLTLARDGKLYRVLNPWDVGAETLTASTSSSAASPRR